MADKRITDVDFIDYLDGSESFFVNQNSTLKQINKPNMFKEIIDVVENMATSETYKGTFLSSGWSEAAPYTQTINVSGILSTDYPFVDVDLSDVSDVMSVIEAWNFVNRCTTSGDNAIVAYCYEDKPEADIPVVFRIIR